VQAHRSRRSYSAAMPSKISIANVPDEVRDELAARARRSGRSLPEYLRGALIDLASRPDPALLMSEVRARTAALGTSLPAQDIVELLDEARS
jgi:plasmid stability protein